MQLHPVVSVLGPRCTFLRMNDCILPIHLNSTLHITSTLIWQLSVFCCMFILLFCAVHIAVVVPWFSLVFLDNSVAHVAEMTFPRRWPAFYDDCKRWKCFTTHFRTFVVINKTALNYICVLLSIAFLKKNPNRQMNVVNFLSFNCVMMWYLYSDYVIKPRSSAAIEAINSRKLFDVEINR